MVGFWLTGGWGVTTGAAITWGCTGVATGCAGIKVGGAIGWATVTGGPTGTAMTGLPVWGFICTCCIAGIAIGWGVTGYTGCGCPIIGWG